MFDNIENLKIISSLHRKNKPYVKIEDRKTHSLFIRVQGSMLYEFQNKSLLLNEGDIMFMPKGASYTAKTISENAVYTSIHFDGDFTQPPQPACYSLDKFYEADFIKECFADMWNLGTQSEKYQCISLFYSLLSYLSAIEHEKNSEKNKFKIINPAVAYLKDHIYDPSLKTDKLHQLCGISNTYFRRIFILRFGVTPQSYITSKRISHAKAIISSGDFNTISEVALSIGFNDPLYFSKVFKKTYGISPSELHKHNI